MPLNAKLLPWISADYYLPRANHMPVEVQLSDNTTEFRVSPSGDWTQVIRWRMVQLDAAQMRKLSKINPENT